MFETDLKRMLAYSSVAQIGYITLGIGLANQAGLTGGLVHVVNHALMKAALFLAVGAIFYRVGTVQLEELAGIGRKMPLTMAAFTIAGFGLVGTPGTAGFISKWYLAVGALDKGWWPLVFLIVASSLIALVYVGRVLEVAWLREPVAARSRTPATRRSPCCCRSSCWPPRPSISASTPNGRPASPARPPRRCSGGCDDGGACRRSASFSLAVLVPFVGALLIPLFHSWPNLRETVTLVTAARPVPRRARPARAGARRRAAGGPRHRGRPGLALAFKVEPLGMLFALVASVAVDRQLDLFDRLHAGEQRAAPDRRSMSASPSRSAARWASPSPRTCSRCSCSTKLLTISTYPLVTHKGDAEAIRAGRLYLLLLLGTSLVLFLPAIVATWVLAGHARFHARRHPRRQGRRRP